MKHRAGWTLRRVANGTHVWISPEEKEYLNPPIPLTEPAPSPPQPSPPAVAPSSPPF